MVDVRGTLPTMALKDLVVYFAKRRAERPNYSSLYQMAERHGWEQDDVLAFLRCQGNRPSRCSGQMSIELGATVEELRQILHR